MYLKNCYLTYSIAKCKIEIWTGRKFHCKLKPKINKNMEIYILKKKDQSFSIC